MILFSVEQYFTLNQAHYTQYFLFWDTLRLTKEKLKILDKLGLANHADYNPTQPMYFYYYLTRWGALFDPKIRV